MCPKEGGGGGWMACLMADSISLMSDLSACGIGIFYGRRTAAMKRNITSHTFEHSLSPSKLPQLHFCYGIVGAAVCLGLPGCKNSSKPVTFLVSHPRSKRTGRNGDRQSCEETDLDDRDIQAAETCQASWKSPGWSSWPEGKRRVGTPFA